VAWAVREIVKIRDTPADDPNHAVNSEATEVGEIAKSATSADDPNHTVNSKATEIVYIEIPYSELEQSIENINSPGHGFIVDAYLIMSPSGSQSICRISETPDGTHSRVFPLHDYDNYIWDSAYNYFVPQQFERYEYIYSRIDAQKKYKIFFGVYYNKNFKFWSAFIDKIEGLRTMDEVRAEARALEVAEAEALAARRKAEAEALAARRKAEAEAHEAKQNPNRLDRSLYRVIKLEEFSFDMVTGRLPVGSKVAFMAQFSIKPTGTRYHFGYVDFSITVSTTHNFVLDIPDRYFGIFSDRDKEVKVYLTIKRAGQRGECSVDIIEWQD
jgi:hypothetical protein